MCAPAQGASCAKFVVDSFAQPASRFAVPVHRQVGADPTVENEAGESPLHLACEADRVKTVSLMLDADPSEDHELVLSLGPSSRWNYSGEVQTVLLAHEKKHKDILALREMRSFLASR